MKKINAHFIFIAAIFILSLFFLNKILHSGVILDNIHYINDLTFLSHNVKESLNNNELALWTPYFYSGQPLLAIPESYMFDLNFLLIYLFRNIYLSMNLALIFYFFLAGFGMYLLVNVLLESKKAAFVSSIIYMFSGYMQSFVIHGHINILEGYALIPLVFLFSYKALKSKDWIFFSVLAGIFFALQLLSGSIILFFYTALLVLFYFAFNLISRNFAKTLVKSIFVGVIILVVTLSLASIKLLPVLEFTKISSRSVNVSFQEYLGEPIKLSNAFGVLVSNAGYARISGALGIIGIILMIYGLLSYKKKFVLFSLILIVFSLLFASGSFVADMMYKVPGFDRQRHVERSLVLFVFAGSILASYGFIAASERLKKFNIFAKYKNSFYLFFIIVILVDLVIIHPFPTSAKIIAPEEIKLLDYISKDNSKFRTMNIALKDIIGAAGYNYYAQKGISEAKGGGGIWVNDYVNFLAVAQQSLSPKILGILNVKYVISEQEIKESGLELVKKFDVCNKCALPEAFGPYLYKNPDFLPRYYVVPNSILVIGENSLVKKFIYNLMFQNFEPNNTVLTEGAKLSDYNAETLSRFDIIFLISDSIDQEGISKLKAFKAQGGLVIPDILNGKNSVSSDDVERIFSNITGSHKEIKINEYSNNKVMIELNGEKGWLVASERFAYFPGWEASINGKDIEIFKANNIVSSVYLEGQKGKLVFEYKPSSYSTGRLISLMTFVFIIIYFGYFTYRKKIRHGDKNQA